MAVGDEVQEGNGGWGNVLSWQQGEVTSKCHHAMGEGVHEWVGLKVEVAKHFVKVPASGQQDG
jgi:hypothetical protein